MNTKGTKLIFALAFSVFFGMGTVWGQIFAPEGLNIPGSYDSFNNPPTISAFASSTQASGDVTKISAGTVRWQTTFSVAASGGDITAGTYDFLFTSGATGSEFANKWANVTVTMNTVQAYTKEGSTNNSITVSNGNWYTMNWKDNGYADTEAIFMETSAEPVSIDSSYLGATSGGNFAVNIELSSSKSAEERVYVRYSTDDFATSKHVLATGSGTSYSADVPAVDGTQYYILTTTVDLGSDNTTYSGDYDMATIKLNNNYDGLNYFYFIAPISGDAGWRLLSLPKNNADLEDISDDTPIQGITGGADTGFDSNVKTYDETGAYEDPSSVTDAISNGLGLAVYFYNNTTNGSEALPDTLDIDGSESNVDVTVDLNTNTTFSSSYFTLVGNPYMLWYDISNLTTDADSIQDNVQFWDDANSTYEAGDRTTPYIVRAWQGFWVEVLGTDAATTLTFPTSGKVKSTTATGTFFSKENPNRADINFTLSSETTMDKAIRLSLREYATMNYDRADASKLVPLTGSYATMAFVSELNGETKLKSVESLPFNFDEKITLDLQHSLVGVSGEFTLNWENVESVSDKYSLVFHDYEVGVSVDMTEVSSYTFTASATSAGKTKSVLDPVVAETESENGQNRFGITLEPSTTVSNEPTDKPITFGLEQNYPNPFNPSTTIKYSVGEAGPVSITVYNVMGQKVAELVNTTHNAGDNFQVTWNATGNASGIYYYRLTAPGQTITRQMTLIK